MWVVKVWPKKYWEGKPPLCSWHEELRDAKESARICRSKRVYKKIIVEKEVEKK